MDGSCNAAKAAMSFGGVLFRRSNGSLDVLKYEDVEQEHLMLSFPAAVDDKVVCEQLWALSDKLRVVADETFIYQPKEPVVKTVPVKRKRKIETIADARKAIAEARAKRAAKLAGR